METLRTVAAKDLNGHAAGGIARIINRDAEATLRQKKKSRRRYLQQEAELRNRREI